MKKSAGRKSSVKTSEINCLFLDIGGVLLSNGWDHPARLRAADRFELDREEMEERHRLIFPPYEEGRLTLNEYLDGVVFHRPRPFSRANFRRFMFAQSEPRPEMLELAVLLKARYGLKIFVVSNEGRELNEYRIEKFGLDRLVDAFVSSCYVHLRKPDPEIFRLALDLAQREAGRIVYIENTPLFTEIASGLGIRTILHTDYRSTRAQLASFGLREAE